MEEAEYRVSFENTNKNKEKATKIVKRNFIFIMVIVSVLVLCNMGIGLLMLSTERGLMEHKLSWNDSKSSQEGAYLIGYGLVGLLWKVIMFFLALYTALIAAPAVIARNIFMKKPEDIWSYRVLMGIVYFFLIIPEMLLLLVAVFTVNIFLILLTLTLIGVTIYNMVNIYSRKMYE